MRSLIWLSLLTVAGCTSISKRQLDLVQDRALKLRALSSYQETWCRVDAKLTEPAAARYAQMFPEESLSLGTLSYTWKASEIRCEVTPLSKSKVIDNHKAFMDEAFCTILHTHWVNSPFDELVVDPSKIEGDKKEVRIRTGSSPDLGLFLDRENFVIQTKTKSRGIFKAEYAPTNGEYRPTRIEHVTAGNTFVLDQFTFQGPTISPRTEMTGFFLSIGNERPLAHTEVTISGCRRP